MEGERQLTDIWSGKKVDYWILNEEDEKTPLRIDKWVADILHKEKEDLHSWLQEIYRRVAERYPSISRREKGNYVRHIAESEARKSSRYVSVRDLL